MVVVVDPVPDELPDVELVGEVVDVVVDDDPVLEVVVVAPLPAVALADPVVLDDAVDEVVVVAVLGDGGRGAVGITTGACSGVGTPSVSLAALLWILASGLYCGTLLGEKK